MADNANVWAVWQISGDTSVYVWGQGTADNRTSRIMARIVRYGFVSEVGDIVNFKVFPTLEKADNYASEIRGG